MGAERHGCTAGAVEPEKPPRKVCELMAVMRILSKLGDTKYEWDVASPAGMRGGGRRSGSRADLRPTARQRCDRIQGVARTIGGASRQFRSSGRARRDRATPRRRLGRWILRAACRPSLSSSSSGSFWSLCVALSWRRRSSQLELAERVAQDRAEALLRDVLSAEEYARLGEQGYLEVRSPSHADADLLCAEGAGASGRPGRRLAGRVPVRRTYRLVAAE